MSLRNKVQGMVVVCVAVLVGVGVVALPAAPAVSQGVLIGTFDLGPGGAPGARPYNNTAGNTWLMKIWSPLVSFNQDINGLAPQLAVRWQANAGATTWTFTLRPNVKWQDGAPFDATDVKFTLELALNPAFGWRYEPGLTNLLVGASAFAKGQAKEIDGIKITGPLTVEFSLTQADPRFPYRLLWAYILPAHILKGQDPAQLARSNWFMTQPIGTGPWKVARYLEDQYQDTVPNQYYWNGVPHLAHLINRYINDQTAATIALQRGEIQFAYTDPDVAAQLKTNLALRILSGSSFTSNYISLNMRNKRFQDPRVREALLAAIDRPTIVHNVFKDTAYMAPCDLPEKQFWPANVKTYPYNPAHARDLLRAAGWTSDPVTLWTYYDSQQQKDALQAMQQYLAQVGVMVTPSVMDVPAYNARYYTGVGWDASYRGAGIAFGQSPRFYVLASAQTQDGKPWGGWDDPRLPSVVEASERASSDRDYTQGMQAVCAYEAETLFELPLWVGFRYGVVSTTVRNFYWYPAPSGGPYEDHSERWERMP
ncbi:MAG TPA: ABC transporter substrate-binding protein [bacterium]|nr:ABC transporter substrate-binding protein [bacterium]